MLLKVYRSNLTCTSPVETCLYSDSYKFLYGTFLNTS